METDPRFSAHTEAAEDEYLPSLRDSLQVLRRRLWVIVLVATVFLGVAVAYSLVQVPYYDASVKVLIGQQRGITENPSDAQGLQQITQTMVEAVNSRPVAEAVIQQLGLRTSPEDFLKKMSAKQIKDTQFIQIDYKDPDPNRAQQVANAIGDAFSSQVSESSSSSNAITAAVWEPASVPNSPASPNPVRDGGLALVLGAFLGIGVAFLLEYLDDRWQSPEEAEQITGRPNFAIIPEFKVPRVPGDEKKKQRTKA